LDIDNGLFALRGTFSLRAAAAENRVIEIEKSVAIWG
jgi:hypothetical protein